MQRGKDKMACERRAAGDLGGLGIADLPYQNDVRILAENRSESLGKRKINVGMDLHLIQPGIVIFDRVLDRDDVNRGRFDPIQDAVQRRRLSAAGRPGHHHHTFMATDQVFNPLHIARGEPKRLQFEPSACRALACTRCDSSGSAASPPPAAISRSAPSRCLAQKRSIASLINIRPPRVADTLKPVAKERSRRASKSRGSAMTTWSCLPS